MKDKKVCIIGCIPEALGGKEKGGIASHIEELYSNLKFNKIETTIFYNDKNNGVHPEVLSYKNRNDILFNSILGFFKFGFLYDKNFTLKEKFKILADANKIKKLSDNGIDVFHVHSLHNLANKACEIVNVKFVTTDHAFWHIDYNKSKLESNIRKATLISISNISMEKIKSLNIKNKIVKINNPISFIEARKNDSNKFEIYFNGISNAWDRKGLSFISKEIKDICKIENVHFTIVTNLESQEKLIAENPWILKSDVVKLLPPLTRDENLSLLASSNVFLAPSLSEGFSIAYLESVMLSIPIIGFKSNVNEINDALNIEYCLSFEHQKDSIYELLLKIKERTPININPEVFTWEYNIDKYIDVYMDLLNKDNTLN